jgi:hypothetical protein
MRKVIFLMIILSLLASVTSVHADTSNWWNTDWGYRNTIFINNVITNLTNYQVAINVSYNSSMKNDFSDIRFIDNTTELSYWLQEKVDSQWAYFWVKIPYLNASQQKIIHMYYGNPLESSKSNIQNVMIIGDDFNDDTFDLGRWNYDTTCGEIIELNGVLNLSCTGQSDVHNVVLSVNKTVSDGVLEARIIYNSKNNIGGNQYHTLALSSSDSAIFWWNNEAGVWIYDTSSSVYAVYQSRSMSSYIDTFDTNGYQGQNWQEYKIVRKQYYFNNFYKDKDLKYNHMTNLFSGDSRIILSTETGAIPPSSNFWTAYDWVFVRSYASFEPSVYFESDPVPPLIQIEDRVAKLESEVHNLYNENQLLKSQMENLNSSLQNNTQRVDILESLYNGIVFSIQSLNIYIQNNNNEMLSLKSNVTYLQNSVTNTTGKVNLIYNLLSYSTSSFRHNMICDYMKANSLANFSYFGLTCKINRGKCTCS